MIAKSGRRQVPERQRAVEQLRTVAKPYRLRVQVDAEGFPFIPGRHGLIEWHCDGVNCSSCLFPGQFALAVYSDRPRMFAKLWAIPGVKRDQTGDTEMRAVFPPEALEQVAAVVRAHRKPGITSEVAKKIGASTAFGGTSRAEKARSGPTPSPEAVALVGRAPKPGRERVPVTTSRRLRRHADGSSSLATERLPEFRRHK